MSTSEDGKTVDLGHGDREEKITGRIYMPGDWLALYCLTPSQSMAVSFNREAMGDPLVEITLTSFGKDRVDEHG